MSDSNQPSDSSSPSTWDDPRITAYVMNELSAAERRSFEQTIADDAQLRQAVDEATQIKQQLGAWFASETPSLLDGKRREQILAATAEAAVANSVDSAATLTGQSIHHPTSRSRLIPWLLAAAASLAVAIGILPALKQTPVAIHQDESAATVNERSLGEVELYEPLERQPFENELMDSERIAGEPHPTALMFGGEAEKNVPASETLALDADVETNLQRSLDRKKSGASEAAKESQESSLGQHFGQGVTAPSAIAPRGVTATPNAETLPVQLGKMPFEPAQPESAPAAGKSAEALFEQRRSSEPLDVANGVQDESRMRQDAGLTKALKGDFAAPQPLAPMEEYAETQTYALGLETAPAEAAAAAPVDNAAGLELLKESSRFRALRGSEAIASQPESARGGTRLSVAAVGRAVDQPVSTFAKSEGMEAKLSDFALAPVSVDDTRFDPIVENSFQNVGDQPLSTFSIDVDTASYSKVRRTLMEGRLPNADAVRIEELINYFEYQYDAPAAESEHPFVTEMTIASCPWNTDHRLARVAIQGKKIDRASRPPCNLVFLLDTSGSMNQPNKLPLVIEGMKMLTQQLGEKDRVAIVVYAGSAGMVLESTPANKQKKITKALSELSAGGSTNGAAGIQLAYATARDHFISEGVNRVILCTDGDFNVGISGTDQLVELVKDEASGGIFLTALGFGMDNHNDAMMEQISGKGNGNYAFIDTANEACKVLVHQTNATLVTIAKDVKLQIEFNGRLVSQYRLIGYENRVLAKEDFNNDKKDAGEIGAGHQVTAIYELVMANNEASTDDAVDPLKYQRSSEPTAAASSDEVMTIKLRYKQPDGDESTLIQFTAKDDELAFSNADSDFRFAAAVASFGMQLRNSVHSGTWTLRQVHDVANENVAEDEYGLRAEFVQLVGKTLQLVKQ